MLQCRTEALEGFGELARSYLFVTPDVEFMPFTSLGLTSRSNERKV